MQAKLLAYGIAAALTLCGVAMLAFGAYLGLREVMAPVLAALTTGVALLVLAVLIARLGSRNGALPEPAGVSALDATEDALREQLDDLLQTVIRRYPKGATLSTLLLGIVTGSTESRSRRENGRGPRSRSGRGS